MAETKNKTAGATRLSIYEHTISVTPTPASSARPIERSTGL